MYAIQLETICAETCPKNSSNIFIIILLIVVVELKQGKYKFIEALQQTFPTRTNVTW